MSKEEQPQAALEERGALPSRTYTSARRSSFPMLRPPTPEPPREAMGLDEEDTEVDIAGVCEQTRSRAHVEQLARLRQVLGGWEMQTREHAWVLARRGGQLLMEAERAGASAPGGASLFEGALELARQLGPRGPLALAVDSQWSWAVVTLSGAQLVARAPRHMQGALLGRLRRAGLSEEA